MQLKIKRTSMKCIGLQHQTKIFWQIDLCLV